MIMEMIETMDDLYQRIQDTGFLPLFRNDIPGFSVEEHTDPRIWFAKDAEGPWEWKGPLVKTGNVLYGKFFENKCAFISKEWFGDFMNYRRDGYDFEGRFNDHLASTKEKDVLHIVEEHQDILSVNIRELAGSLKGVDGVLTKLMMKCYLVNSDFSYRQTKDGRSYGWGIARYSTPEQLLGEEYVNEAYKRSPEESKNRILNHLSNLHAVSKDEIEKILG